MSNSQSSSLVTVNFLPQVARPDRPLIVTLQKSVTREIVRSDDGWSAYVDGEFVGFRNDIKQACQLANGKKVYSR